MSEWIKREDRKPPKGVIVIHTDGRDFWTVRDIVHNKWTHWTPLPAPPPRMLTIEISEEDARVVASDLCFSLGSALSRIQTACTKALEAER